MILMINDGEINGVVFNAKGDMTGVQIVYLGPSTSVSGATEAVFADAINETVPVEFLWTIGAGTINNGAGSWHTASNNEDHITFTVPGTFTGQTTLTVQAREVGAIVTIFTHSTTISWAA